MGSRLYNARLLQGNHLTMSKRDRALIVLGLLISAVFLWLAVRGLNPEAVVDELRSANPLLIGAAAVWYFTAVTVITLRWQFLLRSVKFVPLVRLIQLTCIGYMGNNVYPLRAGEVLRVTLLQRNHGAPLARSAVVSLTERVFDGIVMVSFVIFGLALLDLRDPTLTRVINTTAPLFAIAVTLFFAAALRPIWFRKIMEWGSRWIPGRLREKALHLGDELLAGLEGLRTPKDLFGTVVCSFGSWMLEASVYWITAHAMNLEVSYPLMLVTVGVVNLAGLIPASPGQLGVFEFFVVTVLTAAGIADGPALAYALVIHLVIWLPVTLVGFVFLARMGLGLNALRRARERDALIESKVAVR